MRVGPTAGTANPPPSPLGWGVSGTLRGALATACRRRCEPGATRAEPVGWPRWRRQRLARSGEMGRVLAQGHDGIRPMAESSLLGCKSKDRQSRIGTPPKAGPHPADSTSQSGAPNCRGRLLAAQRGRRGKGQRGTSQRAAAQWFGSTGIYTVYYRREGAIEPRLERFLSSFSQAHESSQKAAVEFRVSYPLNTKT
jgi:hypothetical protein